MKALSGSSAAYRKLGCIFIQGKICKKDMLLARLCLDKAAEMGDEKGYVQGIPGNEKLEKEEKA